VLKPGQKVGAADIVEYMDKRVARIKRITGGVVFLNAIPKNPSGKILRKVLRENARKEIQSNGVRANL
jgi:4-coumarate--CoA ligase